MLRTTNQRRIGEPGSQPLGVRRGRLDDRVDEELLVRRFCGLGEQQVQQIHAALAELARERDEAPRPGLGVLLLETFA